MINIESAKGSKETFGQLFKRVSACKTKVEAHNLLEKEMQDHPWILKDIEYYCGYLDRQEADRVWRLFKDANMTAWYRLGRWEGKNGFIGVTPYAMERSRHD